LATDSPYILTWEKKIICQRLNLSDQFNKYCETGQLRRRERSSERTRRAAGAPPGNVRSSKSGSSNTRGKDLAKKVYLPWHQFSLGTPIFWKVDSLRKNGMDGKASLLTGVGNPRKRVFREWTKFWRGHPPWGADSSLRSSIKKETSLALRHTRRVGGKKFILDMGKKAVSTLVRNGGFFTRRWKYFTNPQRGLQNPA